MSEVQDLTERKQGVWVYEVAHGLYYWYCSACGGAHHKSDPRDKRYCYRCGARMKMEGER